MPYMIMCGGCKKKLRIPDAMVGKTIKCPGCARKMVFKPKAQAPALVGAKATAKTAPTGPAKAPDKTPVAKAPVSKPSMAPAPKTPPAKAPPAKAKAPPAAKPEPELEFEPDFNQAFESEPALESKPAFEPEPEPPPPPVSRPTVTPPRPTLKPPPKKSTAGDDEGGKSRTIFLVIGGVILAGGLFWYLFLSGSSEGLVTGRLTMDNEPVKGVLVKFRGQEEGKVVESQTVTLEDGRYTIRGPNGTGLPPGKYKVTATKDALKDGTLPSTEAELRKARDKGELQNILPKIYEAVEGTPLQFDIHAGSNTVNINLEAGKK